MEKLVSLAAHQKIDAASEKDFFLSGEILMEGAGHSLFLHLSSRILPSQSILLLVGPGNNGGDALVLARYLWARGYKNLALHLPLELSSPLAKLNMKRIQALGLHILAEEQVFSQTWDHIVDGLFGSGLNRPLNQSLIHLVERCQKEEATLWSIDIPSGLRPGATSGEGIVKADLTLTITPKKALVYYPGSRSFWGKIISVDIAFPPSLVEEAPAQAYLLTEPFSLKKPISPWDYKNKRGHLLVVGGEGRFAGAPILSTLGAGCGGAGLITLLQGSGEQGHSLPPHVMAGSWEGEWPEAKTIQSLVIGPGGYPQDLPSSSWFKDYASQEKPMVLDASALKDWKLFLSSWTSSPEKIVLTPHLGEAQAMGLGTKEELAWNLIPLAQNFVDTHGVNLVIKSADSWIFSPHQSPLVVEGSQALMGVGGNGDFLSGLVGAFLLRDWPVREGIGSALFLHQKSAHGMEGVFKPQDLEKPLAALVKEHCFE